MKNKLLYTLLLILSVALSSCSDWLNIAPKTEIPADEMFNKESGFHDALMACYVKMSSDDLYGEQLTIETLEHMAQHWDRNVDNDKGPILFSKFEYNATYCQGIIKNIYGGLYNIIVQANLVKQNLIDKEGVIKDEAVKAVIEGEAIAIRAFCHFEILRLFGQLPANATQNIALPYAENVTIVNTPYYNYNEFIKKIETDLNYAETLLKEFDPACKYTLDELNNVSQTDFDGSSYLTYRRYRLNYWAVKALQARFYLYINKPEQAREMANTVINAKKADGTKLFNLAGNNDLDAENYSLPSETIFAVSCPQISETGKSLVNGYRTISEVKFKTELFKGRKLDANNRYSKVWTTYTTNQADDLPVIRKYIIAKDPENINISNDVKMTKRQLMPILRLSEIYLIAMETSELGTANSLYVEYMVARNEQVAPFSSKEELNTTIINEYRIEFWAEGQMFYTYKRLGSKSMLWKTDSEIRELDYSLPLPKTEVNTNK